MWLPWSSCVERLLSAGGPGASLPPVAFPGVCLYNCQVEPLTFVCGGPGVSQVQTWRPPGLLKASSGQQMPLWPPSVD